MRDRDQLLPQEVQDARKQEVQDARKQVGYLEAARLSVLAVGRTIADGVRGAKDVVQNNPATAVFLTANTVVVGAMATYDHFKNPNALKEDESYARQAATSVYAKSAATFLGMTAIVAAKKKFNEKYDELAVGRHGVPTV